MTFLWDRASPFRSVSPISSSTSTAEVTAGHDASSFLSRIGDDSRESTDLHCRHWVRVSHLECTTSDASLRKLFYPYGGDEAFIAWHEGLLIGYVGFEVRDMAIIAAEKMDAFIPCRQTQALGVTLVTLEEVLLARNRFSCASTKKSFASLLYSNCPDRVVAATLERGPPSACAEEVAQEVKRASPSMLLRITTCVSAVSPMWIHLPEFREELLKQLLRCVIEGDDHSSIHAVNSGTAVGHLFVLGIVPGDPFTLASRLLQRGVNSVAQIDGICSMAHVCHAMPFPMSKASFWALVGHTATEGDWAMRTALLGHLRQLKWSPQQLLDSFPSPIASSVVKAASPFAAPMASFPQDDTKQRTVYISRLHPQLQQRMLKDFLLCAGPFNKVRICAGNGYSTLFAFVEMQDTESARAALRLSNTALMGHSVRVQSARNPIQDVLEEDAVTDGNAVTKPCHFGLSAAPLSACVSALPV